MRKLLFVIVIAVISLALLPIARALAAGHAENMAVLTEKDDGSTIVLAQGDTLVIHLVGNPSTGFAWSDAGTKGAAVKVVSVEYQRGGDLPGSPGVYVITVKGVAAGSGEIHLEYKRAWEKGTPPAKTFALTVQVK